MEDLLEREKVARLNGDKEVSKRILEEMVERTDTDKEVLEIIRVVSKKKGQIKESLWNMIEHAYEKKKHTCSVEVCPYSFRDVQCINLLEEAYKHQTKKPVQKEDPFLLFLQRLLSSVVEGKIYLEGLRVLITDTIKQILLSQNRVEEALDVIYSVHIETFSSVSVEDVVLYQMEQMRLAILLQDKDKASVLSKRVSKRHLEEVPFLKEYYWNRMIFVYLGEKEYHSVAEIFNEIRKTEEEKEAGSFTPPTMAVLYCILSLHHAETEVLMKQSIESKLCQNGARMLGEVFLSTQFIKMDRISALIEELDAESKEIFHCHAEDIQKRLLEHNLLVVAKYYSRISIQSISELFGISKEAITDLITELIRKNLLAGTVDQLSGTVAFKSGKNELEEWCAGINACMDLVIKITHSIAKTQQQ
ncbi:26S proteasome regulatory subunit N5 [Nematocida sp. AWRm77]|nr:26S proteasome regulatory subunit N5 [Nematocida sp. AWRm77]